MKILLVLLCLSLASVADEVVRRENGTPMMDAGRLRTVARETPDTIAPLYGVRLVIFGNVESSGKGFALIAGVRCLFEGREAPPVGQRAVVSGVLTRGGRMEAIRFTECRLTR